MTFHSWKRLFGNIAIAALLCTIWAATSSAQTTQLTQTGPDHCTVNGCINAPLSDGELYSWSDTIRYLGQKTFLGKLAFRGINYDMTGVSSGNLTLDESAIENNGFAVHADYDTDCFRCGLQWDDGYLQLNNEYVGSYPYLYGWNGSVNVTSGTGQVGLVTPVPYDQSVTLTSSDPTMLQVPASVTILHGNLIADFTIISTAPQGTVQVFTLTVTATFQDGTVSSMTLTVGGVPATPPPDN